jgi:hypothetical protein
VVKLFGDNPETPCKRKCHTILKARPMGKTSQNASEKTEGLIIKYSETHKEMTKHA